MGKLFFSSLGVLLSGQSLKTAIHCGCSLAQIGEFAFIIATLGMSLGVIADYIYPIIVSVSVITTLTTPTCIRGSDKICAAVEGVLPKKLVAKLDGYTEDTSEDDGGNQDNDWAVFMRRYMKTTLLYGVIMLGIVIIGTRLIYPAASEYLPEAWMGKAIALIAIYLGVALFIRPMMDTKSPQYTALWMKSKHNRLPLMALNACRLIIIVLIAFAPIQIVTGVSGAWLLPIIAVAVILLYRSGALASAYLSVEARFLANFNERNLGKFSDSDTATEWLDEKLYVLEFDCPESGVEGKSLRELGWGGLYGVNVVKLVRGKKHINMPDGGAVISSTTASMSSARRDPSTACASVSASARTASCPPCASLSTASTARRATSTLRAQGRQRFPLCRQPHKGQPHQGGLRLHHPRSSAQQATHCPARYKHDHPAGRSHLDTRHKDHGGQAPSGGPVSNIKNERLRVKPLVFCTLLAYNYATPSVSVLSTTPFVTS